MLFESSYEVRLLRTLCEDIGSPLADKVGMLLASGKWRELASMKVEPTNYVSAEYYLRDAQLVALLKKHPELPIDGITLKQAAEEAFYKAEKQCYVANERLSPLLFDLGHYGEGVKLLFKAWRKEIKHVLRRCPEKASLEGKFGPGSTFSNMGDEITLHYKLSDNYTTTRQALSEFAPIWDATAWSRFAACSLLPGYLPGEDDIVFHQKCYLAMEPKLWAIRDFNVVDGNRFTTVRKTALTDRGICIEPSLNVYYQLALGSVLSNRLKRAYQWSKDSIQEYHRTLAKIGSLTGDIATIDLSSASDTVSKALVKLLLPSDWYELLASTRSSKTLIQGRWVRLEKFSSMGNGYTFELETLIFYTLCRALQKVSNAKIEAGLGIDISVFGDDIIVPTVMADSVISILRFCGFEINRDKTFKEGPFRESCGGDYFRGFDVRPHFQKKSLDAPERIISCVNGLIRFRKRLDIVSTREERLRCVAWLTTRLPRRIRRCMGPPELGDLVIHEDNPDRWDSYWRNSIRYIRVWRPVPNRKISMDHFRPGVVLAYALYMAGKSHASLVDNSLNESPFRDDGTVPRIRGSYVSGYRFGRVAYS